MQEVCRFKRRSQVAGLNSTNVLKGVLGATRSCLSARQLFFEPQRSKEARSDCIAGLTPLPMLRLMARLMYTCLPVCRALLAWHRVLEMAALKRACLKAARQRLGEAAARRALLSWHCSAKASAQVCTAVQEFVLLRDMSYPCVVHQHRHQTPTCSPVAQSGRKASPAVHVTYRLLT